MVKKVFMCFEVSFDFSEIYGFLIVGVLKVSMTYRLPIAEYMKILKNVRSPMNYISLFYAQLSTTLKS